MPLCVGQLLDLMYKYECDPHNTAGVSEFSAAKNLHPQCQLDQVLARSESLSQLDTTRHGLFTLAALGACAPSSARRVSRSSVRRCTALRPDVGPSRLSPSVFYMYTLLELEILDGVGE